MMHCFPRRNISRLTIIIVCAFLVYNEFLVYHFTALMWPTLNCGDLSKLHTVLLVADPQILGEQTEPWFARWDSDRYLRAVFATALRHVAPDVIVFLGDLMDEGSTATDDEYQRYYSRFRNIFSLDYIPTNKTFFLPGDNDIGGEDEIVTDKKVSRFRRFFYSPSVVNLANIQIVQVDKMQRQVPTLPPGSNVTRVIVSHMPLLGLPSAFSYEVLQKLRPQLVLSAHDHKSVHFSGDLETGERMLVEALLNNKHASEAPSWRFQSSDHIVNEVVVPTCSYRMGVPDMGFGVALLDDRGEAWCYHVLWLPSRFVTLFSYLALLPLLLLLLLCRCVPLHCGSISRQLSPRSRRS